MGVFGRNAKGFVPNRENAGDSAAGTLADVDHRKHFEDGGVARVGHSAVNCLLDADTERARILKRETAFVFFDKNYFLFSRSTSFRMSSMTSVLAIALSKLKTMKTLPPNFSVKSSKLAFIRSVNEYEPKFAFAVIGLI